VSTPTLTSRSQIAGRRDVGKSLTLSPTDQVLLREERAWSHWSAAPASVVLPTRTRRTRRRARGAGSR
jgi:hypothetical protein